MRDQRPPLRSIFKSRSLDSATAQPNVMPPHSVSNLQQLLYKRLGLDEADQGKSGRADSRRPDRKKTLQAARKDQRKSQRAQKKRHRYTQSSPKAQPTRPARGSSHPSTKAKPTRAGELDATSKGSAASDALGSDEGPEGLLPDDFTSDEDAMSDASGSLDDDDDDSSSHANMSDTMQSGFKAVKGQSTKDDADIEEFERKLGIKKGKKPAPNEDGLEDLLGDMDPTAHDSSDNEPSKRKREYDEWLSSKRRKQNRSSGMEQDGDEDFDNFDGFEDDEGLDIRDDDTERNLPRRKENPYVAPTTGTVAKYVPPSRRNAPVSEAENIIQLRKQVRGLINRLTDANILSIVRSIEELYQKNARGDVTEVVIETILIQICQPESLPDQFFILTAGFAAAIYKIIGSSFGSDLLRRVAEEFRSEYSKAQSHSQDAQAGSNKQASNLFIFISQLYVFEVVTCKIVFDYMERLLVDLTEFNVELLLRIYRTSGQLLRRDDPLALKHVASSLNKSLSSMEGRDVSVRTAFMVQAINDLQKKKTKGQAASQSVISEHGQRMKKRLGELKSQSRRLGGRAPMGMTLNDLETADTRGKWWLVGASVPAVPSKAVEKEEREARELVQSSDSEDMDFIFPNFPEKARGQGLITTTQIAMFTALMTATDAEHGYRQFLNLKLRKDDRLEIAKVLVQCVGSEASYNEYYSMVAVQACSNRRVSFALKTRLWQIFRGLGESFFGEDDDDEKTADGERFRDADRVSQVARFYADLVSERALDIAMLKPLDLPRLNDWSALFVEWMMIHLLRHCKRRKGDEDARIARVFGPARNSSNSFVVGLQWFLRKKVAKTKLISSRKQESLSTVCDQAQDYLSGASVVSK